MFICFFFNDTATTEIYTLSLHDALPISKCSALVRQHRWPEGVRCPHCKSACVVRYGHDDVQRHRQRDRCKQCQSRFDEDRKSTRLNSSHANISYAVFCLKKKKNTCIETT